MDLLFCSDCSDYLTPYRLFPLQMWLKTVSSDLEIHHKCPEIHGKPVPDLEVSRRGEEDQGRHGGRRLLEKSDNGSLEETESEESKNCTAPGKTEGKKEDAPAAASQSPPLSPPDR